MREAPVHGMQATTAGHGVHGSNLWGTGGVLLLKKDQRLRGTENGVYTDYLTLPFPESV